MKSLEQQALEALGYTNVIIEGAIPRGGFTNVSPTITHSQEEYLTELHKLMKMKEVRVKRNKLLAETDWLVLPDRTPTQEQLDYRQALRDVTETCTSLEDAVFPIKPQGV